MLSAIGNTPMVNVCLRQGVSFQAKLEGANPFGSMKDRAAAFVIRSLLEQKKICRNTEIIESSSGNFGIALAAVCQIYGLKFTCVTDPMISETNQALLKLYGANVIYASEPDENGSYLTNRLEIIERLVRRKENSYWINQYDNPLMINAYETTLADEILVTSPNVTCVYVPVSTCGCIAGVSKRLKDHSKNIHIVAVDIAGSRIFKESNHIRHIPGMGAPLPPQNLQSAFIDRVVVVSELECIIECRNLVRQGILVGASSGGTTAAIRKTYSIDENIIAIFPDRGDRYINTVYNDNWCAKNIIGFDQWEKESDNLLLSTI